MKRRDKDILVIVGPRSYADVRALAVVRDKTAAYLMNNEPDVIWSGGADGTDTYAEQLAWEWSIPFEAKLPRCEVWDGDGGFRDRNAHMARGCTRLLGFTCRWPSSFGAAWTIGEAGRLGKPVEHHVIPESVVDGQVDLWDRDRNLVQLLAEDGVITQRSSRSPKHAEQWVGQSVDHLLSQLRRQKLRVRWTARPR